MKQRKWKLLAKQSVAIICPYCLKPIIDRGDLSVDLVRMNLAPVEKFGPVKSATKRKALLPPKSMLNGNDWNLFVTAGFREVEKDEEVDSVTNGVASFGLRRQSANR